MKGRLDIIFKDVLKRLRIERNLTQEELAEALGVTAGTIGNYEQGARLPKDDKMWVRIAVYFNVTVDYLMDVENLYDTISVSSAPTPVAAYGSLDDPLKQEIVDLLKNNDISDDKLALIKSIITENYK